MREVAFAKTEAYGNDFILVAEDVVPAADVDARAALARAICERRRGVGGDGLIFYGTSSAAGPPGAASMTLYNSDGSYAEISGNGLRCLAAYLCFRALVRDAGAITVSTGAGALTLSQLERSGTRFRFRADMGVPAIIEPALTLEVLGGELPGTELSLGNPHFVVLRDTLDFEELRRLGPVLEAHAHFPEKTNVELVEVLDRNELRIGIWERGCGETASSGTGSAAAAVAARARGLVDSPVRVHTPGGPLEVEWSEGGPVLLTGEAVVVAEGTYLADWSVP